MPVTPNLTRTAVVARYSDVPDQVDAGSPRIAELEEVYNRTEDSEPCWYGSDREDDRRERLMEGENLQTTLAFALHARPRYRG